jgi:hypothetical protein
MKAEFRKRMELCDERERKFQQKQTEMKSMVGVLPSLVRLFADDCPLAVPGCVGAAVPTIHPRQRRQASTSRSESTGRLQRGAEA